MKTKTQQNTQISLIIMLLFLLLAGMTNVVQAKELHEDTVQKGEVVEENILLFGEEIVIDGSVDGDVIAIGQIIRVNGPITGSLVAIGRDINIAGTIGGSIYSTAVTFELASDATISRSLYFIGVQILTGEESEIIRDLNVISFSGTLSGSVGRELNAIIGPIDLFLNIQDLFEEYIAGDQPSSNVVSATTTAHKYDLSGNPGIQMGFEFDDIQDTLTSQLADKPRYTTELQVSGDDIGLEKWLLDSIIKFVVLLVFGLVTLWLFPSFTNRARSQLQKKFLPASGYGLLGLVISVNMVGVVILLVLLIGAIGIFLGVILLWELAWAFMALGYSALALATTIFAITVLHISKVIVAYFAGWWILSRIDQKLLKYRVFPLIVGVLIYAALIAIPYLGWVIGVIVTALGIGAIWLALLEMRRQRAGIEEIEAVEGADMVDADDQPYELPDNKIESESIDEDELVNEPTDSVDDDSSTNHKKGDKS